MQSLGACFANEAVLELDAGERASGHHGVVASAGAVRVELPWRQTEGKSGEVVSVPTDSSSSTAAAGSRTDRLLSRYLAAALTLAMLPAGEM